MRTIVHKSAKTPSQKIMSKKSFTREEVLAMLNAMHSTGGESVTQGVIAKPKSQAEFDEQVLRSAGYPTKASDFAKPKPKPKPANCTVEAVVDEKGIYYVQLTNADGRAFKFGVRKALEIVGSIDGIVAALNEINGR